MEQQHALSVGRIIYRDVALFSWISHKTLPSHIKTYINRPKEFKGVSLSNAGTYKSGLCSIYQIKRVSCFFMPWVALTSLEIFLSKSCFLKVRRHHEYHENLRKLNKCVMSFSQNSWLRLSPLMMVVVTTQ